MHWHTGPSNLVSNLRGVPASASVPGYAASGDARCTNMRTLLRLAWKRSTAALQVSWSQIVRVTRSHPA
eukprot:3031148-Rhodomonas_salina.3